MRKILIPVMALLLLPAAAHAAKPAAVLSFSADHGNEASIQRGARNFMNYCAGCHGVQFLRYNRIARDLGIPEAMVEEHLIFSGAAIHDHMHTAMPAESEAWFGQAPPDLSLTSRAKGAAWIYSFLNTYYVDTEQPTGYNNLQLSNAAMPHVLEELQGVVKLAGMDNGKPQFEVVVPGKLSPEEYRAFTADLTNFLAYAGEPGKAARISRGWKVMFYLFLLLLLTWLVKREYWKDVH